MEAPKKKLQSDVITQIKRRLHLVCKTTIIRAFCTIFLFSQSKENNLFANETLNSIKLGLLWDSVEIENVHLDLIKELRLKFPGIRFRHLVHTTLLDKQKTKGSPLQKVNLILKQVFSPLDEAGIIWNDKNSQNSFWNPDKSITSICDGLQPCFEDHLPSSNHENYYLEELKFYENQLIKLELTKPNTILSTAGIWDYNFLQSANNLGYKNFAIPYYGKTFLKRIAFANIWNQNMESAIFFENLNKKNACQILKEKLKEENSSSEKNEKNFNCHKAYLLDNTFAEDDKSFLLDSMEYPPQIMVRVKSLPIFSSRLSKIMKIIENICTKSGQCEKFAKL